MTIHAEPIRSVRRRQNRRSAILAVALLGAVAAPRPAAPQEIAPLAIGRSEAFELEPGGTRAFSLTMAAGDSFQLAIDHPEEHSWTAELHAPSGRIETESREATPPEVICGIAAESGSYRLDVRRNADPGPGQTTVLWVRGGASQPEDRERCTGEQTFKTALAASEQGDFSAAQKGFEAARDSFRKAGDLPREIESLYRIGRALRSQGQADLALERFEEALPLVSRLAPQAATDADAALVCGKVWNLLGLALLNQGKVEEGRRYIERAVELARCWPDEPKLPYSSWALNLANAANRANDLSTARQIYLELLARPTSDGVEIGRLNLYLGLTELTGGNLDLARKYLDQAEAFGAEDAAIAWQVWHERCALSSRLGLLDEALDQCGIALRKAEANPEWEASTLNLLGSLQSDLGSYEPALQSFERAREIYRRLTMTGFESYSLCNLGVAQGALGQFVEALKSFAEAAKLAADVGDPVSEGLALYSQGRAELQRTETGGSKRDTQAAQALLLRALDRMVKADDLPGEADTQLELATAETRLAETDAALGRLDQAFALADKLEDPVRRAAVLTRRAEILATTGKLEPGLAAIQSAVREIDDLRTRVASPQLRASFFARRRRTFELQIEILMRLAKANPSAGFEVQAFEASEAARARSLLDMLVERNLAAERSANPELVELLRQSLDLDRDLNRVQAKARATPQPSAETQVQLDAQIGEIETSLQEVERRLRTADPRYAAVRFAKALDARAIQSLLGEKEILLEYALGSDAAYLFAVTREQIRALPLDGPAIAGLLPSFRTRLAGGQGLPQTLQADARKLYDLLLAPAAELLATKDRILVAADGDLYFLPFEVLIGPAPTGAPPAYLIESKTISYTPSASVLARLGELPVGQGLDFLGLAVADPGDGSVVLGRVGEEVRGIASLYPAAQSRLLLDGAATENGLRDLGGALSGARRIHFATHGYLSDDPQRMGLRLAPDRTHGDGLLQAFEVLRLDLHADLVVLSACETAVGQQVPGEGVLGLPRAFFYAGARSVAVSLWRAPDDTTARLMTSFYSHLQQGLDKAEALRQAKLERIRDRQRPYLWAPFVLVGSPVR